MFLRQTFYVNITTNNYNNFTTSDEDVSLRLLYDD